MSLAALRDAIDLLTTRPVLWLPGLAFGLLCALLWIMMYYTGMFFAARFLIVVLLAAVFFAAMTYGGSRGENATVAGMARTGASYYFRILTPVLVIMFGIFAVFFLVVSTLALLGMQTDPKLLTFLTFGVMLPSVMLSFFADCAALFEERKVFESIQRSIQLVTFRLFETILFYLGCFLIISIVSFGIFIAWTAALADRLEPITHYNETQLATFTPDQFLALIGTDGIWISAVCVFCATAILFPLLLTYKACFFRIIAGAAIPIQQVTGEFDSKGRWYKY